MRVEHEPVYLRALEDEDLDRIHHWHNDPELYEQLLGSFWPTGRSAAADWLKACQRRNHEQINFAVCLAGTGEHIGNIYLREIDWLNRRGELHLFIGDSESRGKGYGRSAVKQLVHHAFERLGLQRIFLHVLASNTAARRLYERSGFRDEGLLRGHVYKRGRWTDVVVMGLCRGEAGEAPSHETDD